MTLSEIFEAFEIDELISEGRSDSTVNTYRDALNSLKRAIGTDLPIELLTHAHIVIWKKSMHDRGNSLNYICQHLRKLRRVLTYAKRLGCNTLEPYDIRVPKGTKPAKTAWLTIDELRHFMAVIDNPRDKALFAMQFSSGGRISELLQLNRDSVKNGRAMSRGKGHKEKEDELLFDDRALIAMDKYLATRNDSLPALFTTNYGRMTVKTAIHNFHKYIDRSGVELNGRGATHILRHTHITDTRINGASLEDSAELARHAKSATTKIYDHSGDINRRTKYDKYHTPTPV